MPLTRPRRVTPRGQELRSPGVRVLARLQVDGFKNLEGVDVRFGPFTCVAGPNGVGKSNLFDAIAFLSALANHTLVEAAASVRGAEGRVGDVRTLFRRGGSDRPPEMAFTAELLVPKTTVDELGLTATANATLLRYTLRLRLRTTPSDAGPLEVVEEALDYLTEGRAKEALRFSHSRSWRESVVVNGRSVPFLDTADTDAGRVVQVRADSPGGKGGGTHARSSPRTCRAPCCPPPPASTARSWARAER